MATLIQIASAWYNYTTASPLVRQKMEQRLTICDTCSNKEQIDRFTGALIKVVGNKEDAQFRCKLCKCPLATLSAGGIRNCKAGKWTT